jgi:hypothetical protein
MPSHTITPVPSLSRTATPPATSTQTPSATVPPSPTPTPLVEGLGQVVFSESFDDLDFPFDICGKAHIESGVLVVERGPEDPSPCGIFSGGIYGRDPIAIDTTAIILFKTTSDFNVGVHTGNYTDETLRRFTFGLSQGIGTWDIGYGSFLKSQQTRVPGVDTWYYFSIRHSSDGDFEAKLWQQDTPQYVIEFHGNLGPEWGTLPFTFVSDFTDVPFLVDEFQILK